MDSLFIYKILLKTVFIASAIVFISLYLVDAPYGRHVRSGWGPTLGARAGWIIMETPAVIVIALCFIYGNRTGDAVSITFLALWELHYIQRTYVFPLLMQGGNKEFPILISLFAIIFNVINGYVNGQYLFNIAPMYPHGYMLDPKFIAGVIIFLAGFAININSDHILRNLRKPGETGYKIPTGGFFKFVSCPNYFGEILEWTGWAILTWSASGLSFAVFTAANLVPRAHANHKWYLANFPSYPKNRKRVIPFIY